VTRWPQRLGFFATLPLPDVEAALAEIDYALDTLHADGIGLLSNYQGIYLGDARFDPIFAELDRRQAVVFIHPTVFTGSEIPRAVNAGSPVLTLPSFMLEFVFDTTRAVANLVISGTLTKYPHLCIILSHAGGTVPFVAQKIVSGAIIATVGSQVRAGQATLPRSQVAALRQAVASNVLSQLSSLYYDTALSANSNAFSSLRQLVPASHILLGTDYPFAPEIESGSTAARLATLPDLGEQELQEIEGINALKLFPRLQ
jgi:predicted TIM-barrel fold metal-dependent hydrolase